jgi:hypothetical protein
MTRRRRTRRYPALVNDATAVVEAFKDAELDESAASALALLALVAGQDVEPAEGSDGTDGRWRIARKAAEDRVISVNDPDARHTRKSQHARRDGYRAHVAADPETGIITDEKLTRAAGEENSDPAVAAEFAAAAAASSRDSGGGNDASAWYGDTALRHRELRETIGNAGHQAVIKPKPVQPAVKGGFTRDDFTVDDRVGTVTCPAGGTRAIPPARHVVFGAACRTCPLREQCITSKSGRVLSLPPRSPAARRPSPVGPGKRMPGTRVQVVLMTGLVSVSRAAGPAAGSWLMRSASRCRW